METSLENWYVNILALKQIKPICKNFCTELFLSPSYPWGPVTPNPSSLKSFESEPRATLFTLQNIAKSLNAL